ncbi:unnamed protein product [Candidula unifasciata]|uniref:Uncharacterized protein n=1 Tax=Candidula unifasciata TaxID=100452 RepID=A0A8S3YGB3_9EUPU|nr:unnamed protein product [Candidula unifasciata]
MNNSLNSPGAEAQLGSPRILEEGRPNYERNNRASDWFGHNTEVIDIIPESRLKFEASRAKAAGQDLQNELSSTGNGHADNERPEAHHENSDAGRVDVNNLVENYANLEVSAKPGAKTEGDGLQERDQVTTNGLVNHSSATPSPDSDKAQPPRLDLNGGKKIDKNRSVPQAKSENAKASNKQGRLHQESSGGGWDQIPPHHRLRADGEGIAKKNKTDSVNDIFLNSNTPEKRVVREPRIPKNLAEDNTPRKQATPRGGPEGLQNRQKAMNHSEMSAIMHGSPVEATSPRPSSGRKTLPHMQRSELW